MNQATDPALRRSMLSDMRHLIAEADRLNTEKYIGKEGREARHRKTVETPNVPKTNLPKTNLLSKQHWRNIPITVRREKALIHSGR